MIDKAVDAGGSEPREKQDHGWMYGRSFEDIDGHLWEVFFMEEIQLKLVKEQIIALNLWRLFGGLSDVL